MMGNVMFGGCQTLALETFWANMDRAAREGTFARQRKGQGCSLVRQWLWHPRTRNVKVGQGTKIPYIGTCARTHTHAHTIYVHTLATEKEKMVVLGGTWARVRI